MDLLIIFCAKYLIYLILIIAVFIYLKTEKSVKRSLLKLAILTFPLSFITAKILSFFIQDPRPFVVQHIQPLISHAADNGFPSDHTLLSITIAAIIFVYNKRVGLLLSALALLVGIARIAAKVHYPLDILGSTVIAILATYAAWHFLRYFKLIN